MPFADSQYVDGRIRVRSMVVTRCTVKSYVISGAAISFLGAFFIMLIPFLFSQLLTFVMFPLHSYLRYTCGWGSATWERVYPVDILFPYLYYHHPYLLNLITIIYVSVSAGTMAVFSFALSLYLKKGRLFVLGIPTILVVVSSYLLPRNDVFTYCLISGAVLSPTLAIYLLYPVGTLVLSIVLITLKNHYLRDEL
jgi:hypothetical protein